MSLRSPWVVGFLADSVQLCTGMLDSYGESEEKQVCYEYNRIHFLWGGSTHQVRVWDRYWQPSLCRLYLPTGQTCRRQTDHHSPRQGRVASVAGETSSVGRCSRPDPDRDGSHLPRRGRIFIRNWNGVGIDCVYCIQGKRISFTGNKACAPRRTTSMR